MAVTKEERVTGIHEGIDPIPAMDEMVIAGGGEHTERGLAPGVQRGKRSDLRTGSET